MSRKKNASNDLPEPADDHDRKLLADVERHGWHAIGIEEDEEGPAFAYSIGLYRSFGHPEIIVLGLPVEVMHRVVNAVGEEARSGERFEHLDESGDVLDGYNVCFRTVERRHYPDYFGYARWFYRGDDFPALRCVWPDSRRRYPWHAEFNATLAQRQPLLTDDKSWPFHDGKNRAVFTTKPVLGGGRPILLVTHDRDGDWQFLCGTTDRPEDGQLVSLGGVFERDRTLVEVADLPEGWTASRGAKGAAWRREKPDEKWPSNQRRRRLGRVGRRGKGGADMKEDDTRQCCVGMEPELERELLSLIGKGEPPLEVIRRLREATGMPFKVCKQWVVGHTPTTITPCPYCQAPLATPQAKQCFRCGHDWHDPGNVVRRGDPDWNRFGLKKDATYVVELCQKPTGERYTKYREAGSGNRDPHCVLETEPAPGSRFIEWGFYEYAKHLRLADGREFGFEAHGVWMTRKEAEYKIRRVRGTLDKDEQPPWVNGIPPRLPPK